MEVVNTVGRRKAAVARVYVKPGKGQITINRKALEVYFPLEILQYQVKQPLLATNTVENYDIAINRWRRYHGTGFGRSLGHRTRIVRNRRRDASGTEEGRIPHARSPRG